MEKSKCFQEPTTPPPPPQDQKMAYETRVYCRVRFDGKELEIAITLKKTNYGPLILNKNKRLRPPAKSYKGEYFFD